MQGPQGQTGATGPQGLSGIVSSVFVHGGAPAVLPNQPEPTNFFMFGPVATVRIDAQQTVVVHATGAFGTNTGGANSLKLDLCYRVGATGPVSRFNGGQAFLDGLSVGGFTRLPFSLSTAEELPPETYQIGMCGVAVNANWNHNDWIRLTVQVFR